MPTKSMLEFLYEENLVDEAEWDAMNGEISEEELLDLMLTEEEEFAELGGI